MSFLSFRTGRSDEDGTTHNAKLGITGRAMPPITIMSPSSVRYYKMHFLEDGFPAQKRADGSIYEHPLYPHYIAEEYLKQNARNPDPQLVEAAKLVMDAALKRAQPFGNAMVFWYGADANVSRASHQHYSALTQAYYIGTLAKLNELLGRDSGYGRFVRQFTNSLSIPASEGGVMRVRHEGWGIEELPLEMPDLVLNGWLSALAKITTLPDSVRRRRLSKFMDNNLDLLEHLLPRYDMPALENSRYSLSGFVYLRLTAASGRVILRDPRVSWSADEKFDLGVGNVNRWQNFLVDDDVAREADGAFAGRSRSLRANLVLSQLADENAFEFVAWAAKPTDLRVEIMTGQYSPLTTIPAHTKWVRLETLAVTAEPRAFRVRIGAPHTDLIGYPTNFQKSFDGVNRNVYHPIHVRGLYHLHRYQDRPAFSAYAKRWTEYMPRWKNNPLYARVSKHDYSRMVPGPMRKYLTDSGVAR